MCAVEFTICLPSKYLLPFVYYYFFAITYCLYAHTIKHRSNDVVGVLLVKYEQRWETNSLYIRRGPYFATPVIRKALVE